MSRFIVYDAERERVGMLQNADSIQWLESYQSPGEIKIDAQVTAENLAMLIDGNRIYNFDTDTVARICHVDIVETETEQLIIARADITSQLFDDRVVMATENVTDVEAGMYEIYANNRRNLPIELSPALGYTERTEMQITWNSVLDALQRLAEISGLGFKVLFDPETGVETLKVYKGVDRSVDGSPEYPGYFSTDVGNIQNVAIAAGSSGYKNVAVVAGAGEGADRTIRIVSLGPLYGENRREMFVDARDLQREYQVSTPTGEEDEEGNPTYSNETRQYTEEEYNAILDTRGLEKLAENLRTFAITCDVTQTNMWYGTDYNLGDRMAVKLPEFGINATARISSVTMIYEAGGNRIVATLSDFELEESQ